MARITIATDTLRQLPCTAQLTVDDDHLDIMGHMNTQHYWSLYAQASRAITRLTGVTEDYVDEQRKGAFMLKNFTQFIAEARAGDQLAVYTRLIARSTLSVHASGQRDARYRSIWHATSTRRHRPPGRDNGSAFHARRPGRAAKRTLPARDRRRVRRAHRRTRPD